MPAGGAQARRSPPASNADGATDSFGASVAISADQATIAVGAPDHDGRRQCESGRGVRLSATRAVAAGGPLALDRVPRQLRGSGRGKRPARPIGGSISPDATIIAAGLPGGAGGKGAVFVFKRPGGGWSGTTTAPTATLTDFAGAVGDELGNAVATSGEHHRGRGLPRRPVVHRARPSSTRCRAPDGPALSRQRPPRCSPAAVRVVTSSARRSRSQRTRARLPSAPRSAPAGPEAYTSTRVRVLLGTPPSRTLFSP